MKARLISTFALSAVLVTAATGAAGQPRRDSMRYSPADDNFYVGVPEDDFIVGTGDSNARYEFPIRRGERSVSVMILDATERPVSGRVAQWQTQDGTEAGPASVSAFDAVTWERFCTRTDAPVKLKPNLPVTILVMEGTCKDGTPSAPTTGEIAVDFHKAK